MQALAQAAVDRLGDLDVFVANAAATSYRMLTDKRYTDLPSYDLDIVETMFRVNAIGMWLFLMAASAADGRRRQLHRDRLRRPAGSPAPAPASTR